MSDNIFRNNLTNSKSKLCCLHNTGGTTAKIALLAAFFATFATISANAGLFGSNKNSRNNNNNNHNNERGVVQIQLNDFQQRNINGTNLDAYKSKTRTDLSCHKF